MCPTFFYPTSICNLHFVVGFFLPQRFQLADKSQINKHLRAKIVGMKQLARRWRCGDLDMRMISFWVPNCLAGAVMQSKKFLLRGS